MYRILEHESIDVIKDEDQTKDELLCVSKILEANMQIFGIIFLLYFLKSCRTDKDTEHSSISTNTFFIQTVFNFRFCRPLCIVAMTNEQISLNLILKTF